MFKCAVFSLVFTTYSVVAFNWNDVKVEENFDLSRYAGKKWYEIKWYNPEPDPWAMNNFYFYYREDPSDTNTAATTMVGTYLNSPDRCRKLTAGGTMKLLLTNLTEPAKMRAVQGGKYPSQSENWVLRTDYDHFALVILCGDLQSGGFCPSGTKVNVLSTSKTMSAADEDNLDELIRNKLMIDTASFIRTQHNKDCPL